MRVKCALQFWRSRARGVAKPGIVIPMLRGKHFFLWSPCCVGVPLLFFSTPLRWECSKTWFPENSQRILQLLACHYSMRASLFLLVFKSVIPTQRGNLIFKVILREVNCCDADFFAHLQKCDSHPAWGSHFQNEFSRGELLWRRIFKIYRENICFWLSAVHGRCLAPHFSNFVIVCCAWALSGCRWARALR